MDENNTSIGIGENTQPEVIQKPPLLNKNKKLLVIIIVVILILIPVLSLLILQTHHNPKNVQSHATITSIKVKSVSNLQSDNWHVFTIDIPKNWQVSTSMQQGATGLNTKHPVIHQIEITQYYIPGQTGITVQVEQGQPVCPFTNPLTTTLAGLPASYNSLMNSWIIPTTNATINVSISYPGTEGFNPPMINAAPSKIPQSVVNQYQETVNNILKTFKINALKPFHC